MATKALPEERNERLRELVRGLLAEHNGNQSELARRMKVAPGQISEFLSARKGAGPSLLAALVAITGKSFDELMTGAAPPAGAQTELFATPSDRARAAAQALGLPAAAIDLGLRTAAGLGIGDPWEILVMINSVSRAPVAEKPAAPTRVKPLVANEVPSPAAKKAPPPKEPDPKPAPAAPGKETTR